MDSEKVNLTCQSYANEVQVLMSHLLMSGESSDVTLVCDEQVKFKTHKFVLKASSPVFKSILEDINDTKSIIYLRGINQLELASILEFIYCGKATLYQERIQDFIKVGKDLMINEIKDMPEHDGDNVKTMEHLKKNEGCNDEIDLIDSNHHIEIPENDVKGSIHKKGNTEKNRNFAKIQNVMLDPNSSQCPQCNAIFSRKGSMLKHIRIIHEGERHPCNYCSYKSGELVNLKRHIRSKHNAEVSLRGKEYSNTIPIPVALLPQRSQFSF